MVYVDARSDDLPAAERLAWWRERTHNSIISSVIHCDDEADFQASARAVLLGDVIVSKLRYSSIQYYRNERMVRQSDPEHIVLALSLRGRMGLTVNRKEEVARAREFLLYDTSKPFHGWTADTGGECAEQVLVQVPRTLLPRRLTAFDRMAAVRLPGHSGIGALAVDYLTGLLEHADEYRPADAARLSTVTLDLMTVLFAHWFDKPAPSEARRKILQTRIHDFVERQLGDPELTPAMIAAAHGISLRYLHRLFQDRGLTVASWIRLRRLERCRRDLADPRLQARPVHAIASRYGFTNAAHFSRLFAATYGQSPTDYRRAAQRLS